MFIIIITVTIETAFRGDKVSSFTLEDVVMALLASVVEVVLLLCCFS